MLLKEPDHKEASSGSSPMSIEEIMNKVENQDNEQDDDELMQVMKPPGHLYLSPLESLNKHELSFLENQEKSEVKLSHNALDHASIGVSTLNERFDEHLVIGSSSRNLD